MAITPTSLERVDHIHFPMKEAALLTNLSTNISRKNALDGSFAPESTTRQQSTYSTLVVSSVFTPLPAVELNYIDPALMLANWE